MSIKTLIIDDEPKAIAILQNKLERYCPNINIIQSSQDPKEAIKLIDTLQPDLVFLDVSMPELSGFDVLKQCKNLDFEVIFATAFDDYAVEAIKHSAIGYLVKPIDNEDLIEAVSLATKNIDEKSALEKNRNLIENLGVQSYQKKKIVIPSTEGLEFVKIESIVHCEGVDGYTKIHFNSKKSILSSLSIGHFKKMLHDKGFYLVHKSHLINLDYIEKYLNEGYVELTGNFKVPVSRSKRQEFLESLKS